MARQRYELGDESLREIGIRMVVFVPLENLHKLDTAPNWKNILIFAVVGLTLIVVGTEIERS